MRCKLGLVEVGAARTGRATSDAAGYVREVEPDFYAAEMRAFGADRRGDSGSYIAGWAYVAGKLRMNFAELREFVHGGAVDFFLGVEASAHGPFVEEVKERAGLHETDCFGVGKNVERDFGGDAPVEKLVLG